MGYFGWIIFGFFAGLLARAIVPGDQQFGLIRTTLLGIAGSFTGGFLASLVYGGDPMRLHPSGFVGAVVGSAVLLLVFGRRRR